MLCWALSGDWWGCVGLYLEVITCCVWLYLEVGRGCVGLSLEVGRGYVQLYLVIGRGCVWIYQEIGTVIRREHAHGSYADFCHTL